MSEIQAIEAIGKALAHDSLLLCQRDHLIILEAFKKIKTIIEERNNPVKEQDTENGN